MNSLGNRHSFIYISFYARIIFHTDSTVIFRPYADKAFFMTLSQVVDAALAEGATCTDQWFVGCRASHVVCEGPYVQRYIGHANNLVTVSSCAFGAYPHMLSHTIGFSLIDLWRIVSLPTDAATLDSEISEGETCAETCSLVQ